MEKNFHLITTGGGIKITLNTEGILGDYKYINLRGYRTYIYKC